MILAVHGAQKAQRLTMPCQMTKRCFATTCRQLTNGHKNQYDLKLSLTTDLNSNIVNNIRPNTNNTTTTNNNNTNNNNDTTTTTTTTTRLLLLIINESD